MAYIIAHGTVNGYRKITQAPSIGTEQTFLTDIRAEFDNTQTMLKKPCGYLIQMADNGVWISIIKLMFDGERSGNGSGFFAFSAFLPNNQMVEGHIIKQTLDDLIQQYLTVIGNDFTKNVGIDWSFVEQASANLNADCKPRTKVANTHQHNGMGFAYIDVASDRDIEQYLDAPFQPNYGDYRAVFLGTQLQNPFRLAAQTKLTIDFDNPEYDIIWEGNSAGYPNLPKVIHKKEIAFKTCDFTKDCYKSQTVKFAEGKIDDTNATLTLTIPKLEPIEYIVRFTINHPEQVTSMEATLPYKQPRQSVDNQTLTFYGEEALQHWHILIKTTPKFENFECNIRPFDNANILNGINVTLQELQCVSLQVYIDDKENTINSKQIIRIVKKDLDEPVSFSEHFNGTTKYLQFDIPINKQFIEVYKVELHASYQSRYKLESINQNGLIGEIKLRTNTRNEQDRRINEREIKIIVPKDIQSQGVVIYRNDNKFVTSLDQLKKSEPDTDNFIAYLPKKNLSIDELYFTTEQSVPLEIKTEDANTIRIVGKDTIIHKFISWLKRYYQYVIAASIGLCSLLLLIGLLLLCLNWFGITHIKWLPSQQIDIGESTEETQIIDPKNDSNSPYTELKILYENQIVQWNEHAIDSVIIYDTIKYSHDKIFRLQKEDTLAFTMYKQLVWLSKVRGRINRCEWNQLTEFVSENDSTYISNWKKYANEDIRMFVSEVIAASNNNKKQKFRNYIKKDTKNFKKLSFEEVRKIWNTKCTTGADTSQPSHSTQQSDTTQQGGEADAGPDNEHKLVNVPK